MAQKARSGSFSGANALLAANVTSSRKVADRKAHASQLDQLGHSTPVLPTNSSRYPKVLLYKTKRGSAMKYATLDESVHSTYGKTGSKHESLSRSLPAAAMSVSATKVGQDDFSSSPGGIPKTKSVEFGTLQIREYQRAVGDNPSVSAGPPIGLSWDYAPDLTEVPVEDYEADRPPRRSYAEMAMPRSIRHEMLTKEWGASQSEIASAVRESNRIKNSRRRTVNNLDTNFSKMEEGIESIKKGMKRKVLRRKKVREEYEEWKRDVERQWELWAAEAAIEEENRAAAAEAAGGGGDDVAKKNRKRREKKDDEEKFEIGNSSGSRKKDSTKSLVISEDEASAWVSGASYHGLDDVVPNNSGGTEAGRGEPKKKSELSKDNSAGNTRSLSSSEQSSGSATYEVAEVAA